MCEHKYVGHKGHRPSLTSLRWPEKLRVFSCQNRFDLIKFIATPLQQIALNPVQNEHIFPHNAKSFEMAVLQIKKV